MLAFVAALLVIASLTGQFMKFLGGHDTVYGLVSIFNLDAEANVPTFYATFLLLLASLLLAIIAIHAKQTKDLRALHWAILSLIFFYLACDEASSIHELFVRPIRELGYARGPLRFGWVVPGLVAAAVFTLCYLKFWRHLPTRIKSAFLIAGALYVGGALGIEMIEGYYDERFGHKNLTFELIVTVEESLEMAGVIVFIFALLKLLESKRRDLRLRFASPSEINSECN